MFERAKWVPTLALACAAASAAAGELVLSVSDGSLLPYSASRTEAEFRLRLAHNPSLVIGGTQAYRDLVQDANRLIVIPITAQAGIDVIPSEDGKRLRLNVTARATTKLSASDAAPLAQPATPAPVAPTVPPAAPSPVQPVSPATSGPAASPPAPALPGQPQPSPVLGNFREFALDLPVPSSPAFVLLGLSPETVTRPATARELVAALENGVDKTGKLKTGLALDAAPLQLTLGRDLSLEAYKRLSLPMRAALNTQVSVATSAGAGDDDNVKRVALGLNIPLFDRGDPRLDEETVSCLNTRAPPEMSPPIGIPGQPGFKEPTISASAEGMKKCYGEALVRSRAKSAWTLGFGQTWASATGDLNDAKRKSRGIWTSYAYGFEGMELLAGKAQLVLSARRLSDEIVSDPTNESLLVNQDSTAAALQIRLASETFVTALDYSRQNLRIEGRDRERLNRLAIGFDYKLDKNIWLSASVGGEGGRKNGENKNFVFGGIKYGRFDTPQFLPK